MSADAGVVFILPDHHRHRIPAQEALDAALHSAIAGIGYFVFGTERIDVRSVEVDGQFSAVGARPLIELFQKIRSAIRPGRIDHLFQGFHPLRSLLWIEVHNPLVQFLVHGYFYYTGGGGSDWGPTPGPGPCTMWSW